MVDDNSVNIIDRVNIIKCFEEYKIAFEKKLAGAKRSNESSKNDNSKLSHLIEYFITRHLGNLFGQVKDGGSSSHLYLIS